jgi:predicted HTH domain antitoxin
VLKLKVSRILCEKKSHRELLISSGIAAKIAGINRVTFLMELHKYGVLMIDLTEEELLSDFENA